MMKDNERSYKVGGGEYFQLSKINPGSKVQANVVTHTVSHPINQVPDYL